MTVTINMVEVLERTEVYDLVKLRLVDLDGVHVISGEEVDRTQDTMTMKLRQNDSLLIDGKVVLWWNKSGSCFERQ